MSSPEKVRARIVIELDVQAESESALGAAVDALTAKISWHAMEITRGGVDVLCAAVDATDIRTDGWSRET
jgi:hypothetical protein